MASKRFTAALIGWAAAIGAAAACLGWALQAVGPGAAALLAALALLAGVLGLRRHVSRTNHLLAHFVEALAAGDLAARFPLAGGAGFAALGTALNGAVSRLQQERDRARGEVRFFQELIDELPVAVLSVADPGGIRLVNRAARRLFGPDDRPRPADFAGFGPALVQCLAAPRPTPPEIVELSLPSGSRRAFLRIARLERLGAATHVLVVEPIQSVLDAAEMRAQRDLIRVLTHEVLNSLTPVISLAETSQRLLATEPLDIASVQLAHATLLRRMTGLRRFIDSYRDVAHPPKPRLQRFAAAGFARDIVQIALDDAADVRCEIVVDSDLQIVADPDLLAQAAINLVRNAGQAAGPGGHVRVAIVPLGDGAELVVEDDGPGVPAALRSDIFLPFFTSRAEGTGVGLNLARQVAVAHGGTIGVEERAPRGARFRLSF